MAITHLRPRRPPSWSWIARGRGAFLAVALLVAATSLGVWLLLRPNTASAPRSGGARVEPVTTTFVNEQGGYRFSYPAGWRLSSRGSASRVTRPDGRVAVAFGLAPRGGLRRSTSRLVGEIADSYREMRVAGTQRRKIDGRPAVLAGGTVTGTDGARLRFLAGTLSARRRTLAITVFTAFDSSPRAVLPRLGDIVGSFTPIRRGG